MTQPRIIKLSEHRSGNVRFLTGLHVHLEEGKATSWVTVTRTGRFNDPRYGTFDITRELLSGMVENFNSRTFGQDIFIDVAHQPNNGAAGHVLNLKVEGDRLRALVEWTPFGISSIKDKGYRYLSIEYHDNWADNESGKAHGPVMLGAALVVRPAIKRLDPIQLSERRSDTPVLIHPELQATLLQEIQTMWKDLIKKLHDQLAAFKLAEPVIESLTNAASKALEAVTDEGTAKALMESFCTSGKQLAEQIGDKVAPVSITMPGVKGLTEADVTRLFQEATAAAASSQKALSEKRDGNVKLLSDTINAATGLDDTAKKELAEAVADLITPEMSEAQVKKLAENQIAMGNKISAAKQLSGMGFVPKGSAHITVDASNNVKALQESIDQRLGIADQSASQRFNRTGGQLQELNKKFAEKVLAEFDAANGPRLHAEHKMLAGGDGLVSDVAVPAIFERTVIREALYNLVGLQFVDVGTYVYSTTAQIPYSFRDPAAAGRANTRVYEGGSIPRAGVKQTMDTAYPIPQKIAFEVSDELRYLTSNGQLDWDVVAENTRNAARIIGEDTEKLIFDEILNASDEFASTAVVNEATATANGTNKTFVLDQFPVVRPRKVFDMQGTQVGSTLYPITVTIAAAASLEYNGTNTQSAGTYWTMNYNLGEITFVNQLGVATAPANTAAIVVSYSYTTNVFKFDTDLGALAVDAKWDDFLYRYSLRKNVIESDRFYTANYGLMSGTVRTQIGQARQFSANFARAGTDLSVDGNLGRINDLPNFKTTAPGLNMGDQRLIVGERNITRYRMMKPWAMNALENQKDANGRFTGKKEAYGDQFVVLHTPTPLKGGNTSIALFSASARIDRV